jgi:hypothetical protein
MNIFYYKFKLTIKTNFIIIILFFKKNILYIYTYSKKYIINHTKNISQKKTIIQFLTLNQTLIKK